jgi:hypothetical protein
MKPDAALPRVCLVHDYRESGQMSMKLYAEGLGEALVAQGFPISRLKVGDVIPARFRKPGLVDKADSYLGRFVKLPLAARKQRADIFHIVDHSQSYLIRQFDPARTVITCHDLMLLVLASGRLGKRFRPPVALAIFNQITKDIQKTRWIVADSIQTKKDLGEFLGIPPEHVRVIHPGLNGPFRVVDGARERVRAKHGLGDGPLLMQMGLPVFYKNLEGCFRVVAYLRQQGIPAKLMRSGARLDARQLAVADRLGVSEAIVDLGPCSGHELIERYNAADTLLYPSLYEGFGWPPLEAMASGLPVISSRGGSLDEIVGDAALTAEPEDVQGLAGHVAALLAQPKLREELRRRGLAHAARFSWTKAATEMGALYRQVLEA